MWWKRRRSDGDGNGMAGRCGVALGAAGMTRAVQRPAASVPPRGPVDLPAASRQPPATSTQTAALNRGQLSLAAFVSIPSQSRGVQRSALSAQSPWIPARHLLSKHRYNPANVTCTVTRMHIICLRKIPNTSLFKPLAHNQGPRTPYGPCVL